MHKSPPSSSKARAKAPSWLRKALVGPLAVLLMWGGLSPVATAATVYEIQGDWATTTPATVAKGDVVVAVWHYNINDDQPAPGNAVIPNVTATFTVAGGKFTVIPEVCLTDSTVVNPVSAISQAGSVLTCNVGERREGTAELTLTGIEVTAATGQEVSITGEVGGVSAETPKLPVVNDFQMDMKWDEGNPGSEQSGIYQLLSFPWSLRHSAGAEPGPSSVTFRVTATPSNGETVIPRGAALGGACTPIRSRQPQHPFSDATTASANGTNTAPFPTCTMVAAGQSGQYDVTISGLDYSKSVLPSRDTNGVALPTGWDVIASGLIHFRLTWAGAGTMTLSANRPTFTAPGGATSQDLADNNANSSAYTRGNWTGGWALRNQLNPVEGSIWTDTYRQVAGGEALAISGVRPPETGTSAICMVLDTKYVDFVKAEVGSISRGVVTPYGGTPPTVEYFIGTGADSVLVPTSPNYNPNSWECDSPAISAANWVTEPTDLSVVRAIRVTIPTTTTGINNLANLYTFTTIKPGVAIGQDIYTWTSYRTGDSFNHPHRTSAIADKPDSGVVTGAGARYPYTGAGRDILRVVGAKPVIEKTAGTGDTMPGAVVPYTLRYRAEAATATTVDDFDLVDVLPAGTTFVPGSATVVPTSVTTLASGRVQLRWDIDQVPVNTDQFMHYSILLPADADPGDVFVNDAKATLNEMEVTDTAQVKIREYGLTFISKTAAQRAVPHVGGVARGAWTVRLSSEDTVEQAFTDVIDVLPYVGDGRGTDFSGSYALDGPIDVSAMPGATVYYSTAAPALVNDNPRHASNGALGDVAGNTVGWSTTFTPEATAIRVIGGVLPANQTQSFVINVVTDGAAYEDVYVNRAQGVADRTQLVMRTSDLFTIAAARSLMLKKYVQDDQGIWHDAQNIDDYPSFVQGASLNYRLVVTNTGDVALEDVVIDDDKVDLAGLSPLPAGLSGGAVINELLPGLGNAVTIEYSVPLNGVSAGGTLVNNACATPADVDVDESCDPAGVKVLPSSLAWTKVGAGTTERLDGSEWELTRVDAGGAPLAAAVVVVDCVETAVADCLGADRDEAAGEFRVTGLEAGRYQLVETKAPAGYVLDSDPRFIEVAGDSAFAAAIENEQRNPLLIPLTGGRSQAALTLSGGVLMVVLLGMLWQNRRRRQVGMTS